jgi:hypothetical protein
MLKKFILIAIILLTILSPVQAAITITPVSVTSSSIMWEWAGGLTLTNMSIDGLFVCGYNPVSTSFVLSDLKPNEPHTITILTAGDSGSNTTYTTADTNIEQSTGVLSLLNAWWYLIVICLLCLIGMMRKLGIFLIVASAVSLFALYDFITMNVITGSSPLVELPFMIYVLFFIFPLFLVFMVKGGVTK